MKEHKFREFKIIDKIKKGIAKQRITYREEVDYIKRLLKSFGEYDFVIKVIDANDIGISNPLNIQVYIGNKLIADSSWFAKYTRRWLSFARVVDYLIEKYGEEKVITKAREILSNPPFALLR